MTDLPRRLAWHAGMAGRASRYGILFGFFGGFLLHLVLPVRGAWLAGAVAAGSAALALVCVAVARGPLPTTTDVGASLEKVGAADQVAHGLARAAAVLGAFWLGLQLGAVAGLLKA